jgi:hypothetical protein
VTVSAGAGPGVAEDSSYTKPTQRRRNSSSFDDPWTDV